MLRNVESQSLDTARPIFKPDGTVTIKAGPNAGPVNFKTTIFDDYGAKVEGVVRLTVVPTAEFAVNARDDYAVGYVGREIVVRPLANDIGSSLRLVNATIAAGGDGLTRFDDQSGDVLRYRASKPGAYTIAYEAASPAVSEAGKAFIQIDVKPSDQNGVPNTVRDVVSLAPGVPVVASVLNNDTDPNGDVLGVSSVAIPTDPANPLHDLKVEVLKHQYLRITTTRALPANASGSNRPLLFTYHVTDGFNDVEGTVIVRGAETPINLPPLAGDDALSMAPGKFASVPVLRNDVDPEGGLLAIAPPPEAGPQTTALPCVFPDGKPCPPATAFVQDNRIAIHALPTAGRFIVTYAAIDEAGNAGPANVIVDVAEQENRAPVPPVVEARTTRNRPVDIIIPVGDADPDGDVVTLVGSERSQLGAVQGPDDDGNVTDADGKDYAPPPNSLHYVPGKPGTDVFTYLVRDPDGLVGKGTIVVGVLPDGNSAPVAVPDHVVIAPGRTIQYDVTANDSDPDDDPIELVETKTMRSDRPSGVVSVGTDAVHHEIVFRANGHKAGESVTIPYRIGDGHGQFSDAALTIEIKDTAGLPPIALDDVAAPAAEGQKVTVRALLNDVDPDGLISASTVTVHAPKGLSIPPANGIFTFTMPAEPVEFVYTVTDTQKHKAQARVIVPLAQLVAVPDYATGAAGAKISVDVVGNDLPDGDAILDTVHEEYGGHAVRSEDGRHIEFEILPAAQLQQPLAGVTYTIKSRKDETVRTDGALTIDVTGGVNSPPTVQSRSVDLHTGEKVSIELADIASDRDRGQTLQFLNAQSSLPDSVHITKSDSTLTVSADDAAFVTTNHEPATIGFTVTDSAKPPATAEGHITVNLLSSDDALAVLVPDAVEVIQGQGPISIPVLGNDHGKGLELIDLPRPPGPGQGTATINKSKDRDRLHAATRRGKVLWRRHLLVSRR